MYRARVRLRQCPACQQMQVDKMSRLSSFLFTLSCHGSAFASSQGYRQNSMVRLRASPVHMRSLTWETLCWDGLSLLSAETQMQENARVHDQTANGLWSSAFQPPSSTEKISTSVSYLPVHLSIASLAFWGLTEQGRVNGSGHQVRCEAALRVLSTAAPESQGRDVAGLRWC